MAAFTKGHWCECCGHRAFVSIDCDRDCDPDVRHRPHRHCNEGCECTTAGCMTKPEFIREAT